MEGENTGWILEKGYSLHGLYGFVIAVHDGRIELLSLPRPAVTLVVCTVMYDDE